MCVSLLFASNKHLAKLRASSGMTLRGIEITFEEEEGFDRTIYLQSEAFALLGSILLWASKLEPQ